MNEYINYEKHVSKIGGFATKKQIDFIRYMISFVRPNDNYLQSLFGKYDAKSINDLSIEQAFEVMAVLKNDYDDIVSLLDDHEHY